MMIVPTHCSCELCPSLGRLRGSIGIPQTRLLKLRSVFRYNTIVICGNGNNGNRPELGQFLLLSLQLPCISRSKRVPVTSYISPNSNGNGKVACVPQVFSV